MTLKVDPNMESKMYGFPEENNRFHVSLGAADFAHSQKWHLNLTSIWRPRCIDFPKKIICFMCLQVRQIWLIRRSDT